MKKLIILLAFCTISATCYAGILTRHDYVLKKVFGDYILYILPNGMMYKYDPETLKIEEIYLNSLVVEKFTFKSKESAENFIDSFGSVKCTSIAKGIGKCPDPKETSE